MPKQDLPDFTAATLPAAQQWEGKPIFRRDLGVIQYGYGGSWRTIPFQDAASGDVRAASPILVSNRVTSISSAVLQNYRAAIVAAGSSIGQLELQALRDPLDRLIRSSVWPKLRELWLPLGADLTAARVKIKSDATATASMALIGAPTFNALAGVIGDGAAAALNTGFNPTTAALPVGDWGFGVLPVGLAASGILGGTLAGTNTYIAYSVGLGSTINNVGINLHIQQPRLMSVQYTANTAQGWVGGWMQASGAGAAALPNSALTLLSAGGGFWSSQTVAGYAVWSPALTAAELLSLQGFFDAVASALARNSLQASLVGCGDSNLAGSIGGITAAQRFLNIASKSLGLAEDNQGVANSVVSPAAGAGAGQNWLTGLPYVRSISRAGTLYVVMLGTNDDRYLVAPERFAADYEAWLAIQFASGFTPSQYILLSPPAATDPVSSLQRLAVYRDSIRSLARKYGCGFLDVYALTSGRADYFQADNLHLNAAGHAAVGASLVAYVATSQPNQALNSQLAWSV